MHAEHHAHTQTRTNTRTHRHIHTHTHTQTPAGTLAHACMCTHTYTHQSIGFPGVCDLFPSSAAISLSLARSLTHILSYRFLVLFFFWISPFVCPLSPVTLFFLPPLSFPPFLFFIVSVFLGFSSCRSNTYSFSVHPVLLPMPWSSSSSSSLWFSIFNY